MERAQQQDELPPLEHYTARPSAREREACVQLSLARGVGPITVRQLLAWPPFRGSARAPLLSDTESLCKAGLGRDRALAVRDARRLTDLPRAPFVCILDPEYPHLLRGIPDPPPVLWSRGRPLRAVTRIAMVGSRQSSPYGRRMASDLARDLSRGGVEVVSGLALGIDGAAHRGALEGGSGTTAVVAGGVDRIFPSLHHRLSSQIVEDGTLLSEMPPGTPATKDLFPRRNRIISGMSRAVVVVEARRKSGSLITATRAMEQGRPVYVVPADLDKTAAIGSNGLLTSHAALAIGDAGQLLPEVLPRPVPGKVEPGPAGILMPFLTRRPRSVQTICLDSDLPAEEVIAHLIQLQIRGIVREEPGRRFLLA